MIISGIIKAVLY